MLKFVDYLNPYCGVGIGIACNRLRSACRTESNISHRSRRPAQLQRTDGEPSSSASGTEGAGSAASVSTSSAIAALSWSSSSTTARVPTSSGALRTAEPAHEANATTNAARLADFCSDPRTLRVARLAYGCTMACWGRLTPHPHPAPGEFMDESTRSTATIAASQLAVPLSRFVGRSVEMDELDAVLGEHRLVTLLGIGGIGKTRLALALAMRWRERVDEVIVVDFAALQTGDLVDGALLEAAGIGLQSGRAALDATIEHLAHRRALVVLDTCEHVLSSAAQVAERLLRKCPDVRVLTTSRALLDVPGEVAWSVPPLRTDQPSDDAEFVQSDAVALFADCATRAQPGFRLDDNATDAVSRIVRGVDGIPLAIELAAARLRVLTIDEIATGLSDHLRILGGGPVSAARHTMRASLDWSYALLDPELAALFARLSIFGGGWTLPAAEVVCADEQLPVAAMLDAIAGLVDRSLVIAEHDGPVTRYRMLDFVRQYARERLAGDPAAPEVALRHRLYFRDFAERADRELWAVRPDGRASLDAEAPNLRQAVAHAIAHGETDALRLVDALALYWRERGRLDEGIRTIEQALAATPNTPRRSATPGLSRMRWAGWGAWSCSPSRPPAMACCGRLSSSVARRPMTWRSATRWSASR